MDSLEEFLTQPEGLATRLRGLRAQAGLSGKDLADANDWNQSKVSRIENGQQMASAADIRAWALACRAGPQSVADLLEARDDALVWRATFRNRMRHGQAAVQQGYTDLAAESSLIRHFETAYVPGFLQVPAYARRALAEMIPLHQLPVNDLDEAVAARMQRQQLLYNPAKRFEFLLAEPVLRWLITEPAVMRSQLDRLQTVIGLERVRFGILPMGVQLATTPQNSFVVYAGAERTVVAVETFLGEQFHEDGEAEAFGRALDLMWAEAAEGDDARALIVAAARALPES